MTENANISSQFPTSRDESAWRSLLFRAACPDTLRLSEFHADMLNDADSAALLGHLADCPYCGRELALTARFLDAPAPAPESKSEASRPSWRVRIGQLLSDLQSTAPALAVRGAIDEPLIYVADNAQIALTVEPISAEPTQRRLVGFIAGSPVSTIDFWQQDTLVVSANVAASGSFSLDQIAAGTYDVLMRSDMFAIDIPNLVIP